jgi:hypothetical protein
MDPEWQRWNQVAKKRILMKVEEPRVNDQQTPQAGYYVRPNLISGGTKVSTLTARSYATEVEVQSTEQEDGETQNNNGVEMDTNFNINFDEESFEENGEQHNEAEMELDTNFNINFGVECFQVNGAPQNREGRELDSNFNISFEDGSFEANEEVVGHKNKKV